SLSSSINIKSVSVFSLILFFIFPIVTIFFLIFLDKFGSIYTFSILSSFFFILLLLLLLLLLLSLSVLLFDNDNPFSITISIKSFSYLIELIFISRNLLDNIVNNSIIIHEHIILLSTYFVIHPSFCLFFINSGGI